MEGNKCTDTIGGRKGDTMIYRVYTEDKNREAILNLADKHLQGWTAYLTLGGWQGNREPSIVIERYVSSGSSGCAEGQEVLAFAHKVKDLNEQQEVWIFKHEGEERIVV